MTNQEASRILDGLKPNTAIAQGNETAYDIGQALSMAINALEQEPTDNWSIKDVADTFKKYGLIREQEPKTGHWIESDIPNEKYVCSECGGACWYYDYQGNLGKSNYCPNCGCRMVEPQESEDKE